MTTSAANKAHHVYASPEQLRYARVLDAGMRFGLLLLALGFLAYVAGALPVQVPLEELPRLWGLAAADYLRATGMPDGWGWVTMLDRGDVLPLIGMVVLCGVTLACFLVLLPAYAARRDWAYFLIVMLEIGVLVLAASGVLTAGH